MSSKSLSLSEPKWIALALFVLGLALRLIGSQWGLPTEKHYFSLHPDEPIVYAASQQVNPAKGDFDPGFYNYGTFYLTLSRIATDVVTGYSPSKDTDFPARDFRLGNQAGRMLSMLAGAGMGALVFLILIRRTNRTGALLGAFSVAFAPGLMVHSRFQTVDVTAAFWVVLSLYWLNLWASEEGTDRHAIWMGLAAGLAAGTKYNAVLVLLAAAPLVAREAQWRRFAMAAGACVLAFILTTPGILINTDAFFRDFKYEMLHTSTGHGLVFASTAPGSLYHLSNLITGYGGLLLIIGVGGLVWASRRKGEDGQKPAYWLWGAITFAVVYYLLIARAEVKFLRYVFPLIPVLALGVGLVAGWAQEQADRRWRLLVGGVIIAVSGLGGGGLANAMTMSLQMASTDAREAAAEYLKKFSSVGVVSDPWFYTPTLYPLSGAPRSMPWQAREEARLAATPKVLRYVEADGEARKDWDVRLLTELKPEAVVFSSFELDDLDRLRIKGRIPPEFAGQVADYETFMKQLTTDYALDRSFGDGGPRIHDMMYVRPLVWVWVRKNAP